jgi:hypothetical protein
MLSVLVSQCSHSVTTLLHCFLQSLNLVAKVAGRIFDDAQGWEGEQDMGAGNKLGHAEEACREVSPAELDDVPLEVEALLWRWHQALEKLNKHQMMRQVRTVSSPSCISTYIDCAYPRA